MSTTDVQAILTFADGSQAHAWANGFTDTSETEFQLRDLAGTAVSVGDGASGKRLRRLQVQCSDGSYAGPLKYSKKSGLVSHTWYGPERQANMPTDIDIDGLDILIEQGDKFLITTQD
jgi:hypothetical protein